LRRIHPQTANNFGSAPRADFLHQFVRLIKQINSLTCVHTPRRHQFDFTAVNYYCAFVSIHTNPIGERNDEPHKARQTIGPMTVSQRPNLSPASPMHVSETHLKIINVGLRYCANDELLVN
jgi:hypothetical protein